MKIFDNVTNIVKDDLQEVIKKNDRISIAASCFSIYAYNELKKQFNSIEELRFVFTSPTFTTEKAKKEKREFYIPRLNREKSIYGTEFEIKLRNELTQKAIAKECAEWIKKKVKFKSNITNQNMQGFINVKSESTNTAYMPLNGFTTVDIGCEKGNNTYNFINKIDAPDSKQFLELFNSIWNDSNKLQDVTDEVINNITTVYNENSADFLYFVTLYNIFNEFLEDVSEDVLPNDATGFKNSIVWNKLYNFQKDAALAIINKLEKYNGCILADSVGLGKTYTALSVIKYYENRNKNVFVLCPKKISDNWATYKDNYINNPIAKDRLRYDVLYHTDLSRPYGKSNGLDLSRINWGNYDLVVIDESHNFRNGGQTYGEDGEKENRYLKLMNKVIREGVKTKVLMLSATPVNNRFNDLKNQLQLAYEGNPELINEKLNTKRNINDIFRTAQKSFNSWSKLEVEDRTTKTLLDMLDFDFFEVLDSVTIARSRKHIEKFYNTEEIGKFPERLKPKSLRPNLTTLETAINYDDIYNTLMLLNLSIYTPTNYVHESKIYKYSKSSVNNTDTFTQANREKGIQRLMSINLLKRLESSVHSFKLTICRVKDLIESTIKKIESFKGDTSIELVDLAELTDFDYDDQNTDLFSVGKKVKIDLNDMNYLSWLKDLKEDFNNLELLYLMINDIRPQYDKKLLTLFDEIKDKLQKPINENNKKVLIFTAFSDTAEYLYDNVSRFVKSEFGLNTAMITGSIDGKSTIPKLRNDMNTVLTLFSPVSKDKHLLMPGNTDEIDILIATDCISEGQNLQDCDYLINYDIHWNPVRIIQRFGRIDRIGSKNTFIQLVNFWPDLSLDEYINLKSRVETRMKATVMASTGDDDLINEEEKGDLEYRKKQLERLHSEIVDIEDMSSGINIMDLGLNEFRMDLIGYVKTHPDLDKTPFGLHAVVRGEKPGVIFILKNINADINIESKNRLHPFYLVYIGDNGEIISNHLEPKQTLDKLRHLCKGKNEPDMEICKIFNAKTNDGKNMTRISGLLEEAISSIINVSEQSDIDSFFDDGETTVLTTDISGLNDFELVDFIVVL